MDSFWLSYLGSRFGHDHIIDVLKGTGLQQYAAELGFGVYVIRTAVDPRALLDMEEGLIRMFTHRTVYCNEKRCGGAGSKKQGRPLQLGAIRL